MEFIRQKQLLVGYVRCPNSTAPQ